MRAVNQVSTMQRRLRAPGKLGQAINQICGCNKDEPPGTVLNESSSAGSYGLTQLLRLSFPSKWLDFTSSRYPSARDIDQSDHNCNCLCTRLDGHSSLFGKLANTPQDYLRCPHIQHIARQDVRKIVNCRYSVDAATIRDFFTVQVPAWVIGTYFCRRPEYCLAPSLPAKDRVSILQVKYGL